jgi:hypothetical protein
VEAALRARIYEGDAWTPLVREQWEDMLHHTQEMAGARALAAAVIAEAWSMATRELRPLSPGRHSKFIRRKHRLERAAQQEAVRWFSCDDTAPFTFLHLCQHLDPGQMRRALVVAIGRRTRSTLAPTGSSSRADLAQAGGSPPAPVSLSPPRLSPQVADLNGARANSTAPLLTRGHEPANY